MCAEDAHKMHTLMYFVCVLQGSARLTETLIETQQNVPLIFDVEISELKRGSVRDCWQSSSVSLTDSALLN